MRKLFARKQFAVSAACALALAILSGTASAQNTFPNTHPASDRALVVNSGQQVWMNGFGECWHNAYGPPAAPNVQCGPQPVAQAAPAPQPVVQYVAPVVAPAPAPAPRPVVVAQAPQPVYEKVTFNANVLFDFDKSLLRPEGRDALDSFAGRIKGIGTGEISAIGYADRFGTDGYNQKLSERRVATVKDYLTNKGLEGKWVDSSAKGETRPTTRSGECMGEKSVKTIACLQPDRHVFVEISGSRLKQ